MDYGVMGSEAAGQSPKPPVQQRSLASHRQMVDVALRLLETRDIDQISVRDIVCEAGTSNGSFYHRFGTKEHFFNYLIDDMLERRERGAMAHLITGFWLRGRHLHPSRHLSLLINQIRSQDLV